MSGVTLRNVTKSYGSVEVIKGVDIDVEEGEFCVFVGPSGCGKSTLLRMIAGLEEITSGDVSIGGRRVNEVDASRRGTAMVFQTYALYPHMTVERNMGFGLLMNGTPKDEVKRRVDEAARILRLGDYLDRKPKALSGGQRQRVAIGRAIVRDPEVFLFDEPLSNLDAELRVATRLEIAKLHAEMSGSTMIYVTHDQVEAMTLADRIVVLRDGRVEQVGSPMELYGAPKNRFVAGFIGSPKMNFIEIDGGAMPDGTRVPGLAPDVRTLGIRPDGLRPDENGVLRGRVLVTERLGDADFVHFRTSWGQELIARFDPLTGPRAGSEVAFGFAGRTHHFDAGGLALAATADHPAHAVEGASA